MCYFNFLTGKAYKANSDIATILSDYCKKNAIAFTGFATIQQAKKLFYIVKKGSKGARCQEVPFTDHAYGTFTPEQVEEPNADVDQFCPF